MSLKLMVDLVTIGKAMVSKFIVSQAKLSVLFFFLNNSVGKFPGNHKQECKSTSKEPQTFTMHAGHAQEKPHLLICACVMGDLELIKKNKGGFCYIWCGPGLRNNEFT